MVLDAIITICARSGSKRIKDKNLLEIEERSLLEITISQALEFTCKENIFLSSDSESYLKLGKRYGIRTILRPKKLSGNNVSKIKVIKSISELVRSPLVIDLDVSAPIRDLSDIQSVYRKLKNGASLVLGATRLESINPYFNIVEYGNDCKLKIVKEGHYVNTQNSPEVFILNSILGIERNLLGSCSETLPIEQAQLHIMEDYKAFDIDNITDYYIVKFIFENLSRFKAKDGTNA